jgi:hypothetical protein
MKNAEALQSQIVIDKSSFIIRHSYAEASPVQDLSGRQGALCHRRFAV